MGRETWSWSMDKHRTLPLVEHTDGSFSVDCSGLNDRQLHKIKMTIRDELANRKWKRSIADREKRLQQKIVCVS